MWTIGSNYAMRVTRGDTPTFKINLTTASGDPYVPSEGDEIWFVVKKTALSPDILVQVQVPTDTLELKFSENTTRDLEFGNYVYEISLNNGAQDYHDTFIANAQLIITEELYYG